MHCPPCSRASRSTRTPSRPRPPSPSPPFASRPPAPPHPDSAPTSSPSSGRRISLSVASTTSPSAGTYPPRAPSTPVSRISFSQTPRPAFSRPAASPIGPTLASSNSQTRSRATGTSAPWTRAMPGSPSSRASYMRSWCVPFPLPPSPLISLLVPLPSDPTPLRHTRSVQLEESSRPRHCPQSSSSSLDWL